ncbi:PREDICTED: uncharacterized protein LOC104609101 [Nelumbo nucifera]|uniref:Transmembrane protein n=2 Tax=Nelumbo nucifera TaxID=4432 RepID=A0A822ZLB8_NELNU|nr:PREDICTED: uncharacterized protein LOC104609101 [Nelumbo nucifera]DAD45280.1 TPA_asm: hypothetical protein HUJ06_003510 [Nelumbo nucifera]
MAFNRVVYVGGRAYSKERLVAIGLSLLAVLSPLYIDRKPSVECSECECEGESSIHLAAWLPVLLLVLVLIFAISLSCYLDQSFARLDPYWIHRVGGSSCGILALLMVLLLVLKCKASVLN